jgi:hypothetical protein
MKYNSDLCVIPGACTSKLQPADVSWNKPFKSHLSEMYDEWLFSGPVGYRYQARRVSSPVYVLEVSLPSQESE